MRKLCFWLFCVKAWCQCMSMDSLCRLPVIPRTLWYKFGPILVQSIHKCWCMQGTGLDSITIFRLANSMKIWSLDYNFGSNLYQSIGINLYIFNWSLYQHIPSFFMNILGFRKKKHATIKPEAPSPWPSWPFKVMVLNASQRMLGTSQKGRRWLVGCAIPKGNDFQVRTVSFREGTYIKAGCSKWLGK